MIGFDIICDLICKAISVSDPVFHWGEDRIIRGSLRNLPTPEVINTFPAGSYFALVDVTRMTPRKDGRQGFIEAVYGYTVCLCRKGKEGTYSKIRTELCDKFLAGWYRFWESQNRYVVDEAEIISQCDELEKYYPDIMAAEVDGTITIETEKISIIKD